MSFSQNSIYLRVRLRERFVNPQLLKQLAVYKIKEDFIFYHCLILYDEYATAMTKNAGFGLADQIYLSLV